jgi:hypothetical protein
MAGHRFLSRPEGAKDDKGKGRGALDDPPTRTGQFDRTTITTTWHGRVAIAVASSLALASCAFQLAIPPAGNSVGVQPTGTASISTVSVSSTQASQLVTSAPLATETPVATTTLSPDRSPLPSSGPTEESCLSTDQDQYIYNPARLLVQAACVSVTGEVEAVRREADGDQHILVELDPPFQYLLTPANQGEELGDLVVEAVCVGAVTQADAEGTCRDDPDPLQDLPTVGMRVWMQGRYVLDSEHGDWGELHPLYRWRQL